jgi:hypothetical protein
VIQLSQWCYKIENIIKTHGWMGKRRR